MEEKIAFEFYVYDDDKACMINDIEFAVNHLVMLPKIRPHKIGKAVLLSLELCQNADFRQKMLEKSNECPFLIYQLYKRCVFLFEEIETFLKRRDSFLLCYYFRKEIDDFEGFIKKKNKPDDFDEFLLDKSSYIDLLIEHGFIPGSTEFCLKYDDIDDLQRPFLLNKQAKWSPFEWSFRPKHLELLCFSGFFGSIKCFKHLLMNGFQINEKVISMIVCSGCLDLFHLSRGQDFLSYEHACMASKFCHLSLLDFILDHCSSINSKTDYIDFR